MRGKPPPYTSEPLVHYRSSNRDIVAEGPSADSAPYGSGRELAKARPYGPLPIISPPSPGYGDICRRLRRASSVAPASKVIPHRLSHSPIQSFTQSVKSPVFALLVSRVLAQ